MGKQGGSSAMGAYTMGELLLISRLLFSYGDAYKHKNNTKMIEEKDKYKVGLLDKDMHCKVDGSSARILIPWIAF